MKLAEIRELMETFDGMNICRLELEDGAFSLVLSKEHTPRTAPASGRAFPPPGSRNCVPCLRWRRKLLLS